MTIEKLQAADVFGPGWMMKIAPGENRVLVCATVRRGFSSAVTGEASAVTGERHTECACY